MRKSSQIEQAAPRPTPAPVTCEAPFYACNPQKGRLYAVRPGISIDDALSVASTLMGSSLAAVNNAAVEHDDVLLYGAVFQLEAIKAAVDAARVGLLAANRKGDES